MSKDYGYVSTNSPEVNLADAMFCIASEIKRLNDLLESHFKFPENNEDFYINYESLRK